MVRDKPLHNFLFETEPDGFYEGLDCFCTPWIDQCVLLHLVRRYKPSRFLEVGTYKGYTTRLLANKFPQMEIVTVDPGDSISPDDRPAIQAGEYLPQAEIGELVRGYPNVTVLKQRFCDVDWLTNRFDMIFVDGDHSAASVLRDSNLALSLVETPGVIVWHDYNNVPDVGLVLQSLNFPGVICWINNTWIAYHDTH